MKILFTIYSLEVGGAQTFMIRLANQLAEKHSIFIYDHHPHRSSNILKGQLDRRIKVFGFCPKGLPDLLLWKINRICKFLFFKFELRVRLKNIHYKSIVSYIRPDLINSHSSYSDYEAALRTPNTPLLISMHGEYEMQIDDPVFLEKSCFTLKKAGFVVYAAKKNLTIFDRLPNIDVERKNIYYGFANVKCMSKERSKLGISSDAFVFGMVARGIQEKGWKQAIEAFRIVEQRLSNFRIFLILVSGDENYIEDLKKEFKLSGNIIFTGFSLQPLEWINLFDVALLPTYFRGESLPNSIIEYLYAGKPVIATDIGEIPNMITHELEKAGTIINCYPHQAVNTSILAETMGEYITDPDLLAKHRGAARKAFGKFDMHKCVEAYETLFEQLHQTSLKSKK